MAKDAQVLVQAGHWHRTHGATGASGPWGNEIDWTPVVAKSCYNALVAVGITAILEDADFTMKPVKQVYEVDIAVAVHFDGGGSSGTSIGFPDSSDAPVALGWKKFYHTVYPATFRTMPDNFTAGLRGYYGYRRWKTKTAEFLVEFCDIANKDQATWAKPRLEYLGKLLAYYLAQQLGVTIPMPVDPVTPAPPGPPAPPVPVVLPEFKVMAMNTTPPSILFRRTMISGEKVAYDAVNNIVKIS
jgi:hypothetical protein